MEITGTRYKVLDEAEDGSAFGHLLSSVTVQLPDGEAIEAHPASSVAETSLALLDLLHEGLVDIYLRGREEPYSASEAEAIARALASWNEPLCWQYEVGTTLAGDEVLAKMDKRST